MSLLRFSSLTAPSDLLFSSSSYSMVSFWSWLRSRISSKSCSNMFRCLCTAKKSYESWSNSILSRFYCCIVVVEVESEAGVVAEEPLLNSSTTLVSGSSSRETSFMSGGVCSFSDSCEFPFNNCSCFLSSSKWLISVPPVVVPCALCDKTSDLAESLRSEEAPSAAPPTPYFSMNCFFNPMVSCFLMSNFSDFS